MEQAEGFKTSKNDTIPNSPILGPNLIIPLFFLLSSVKYLLVPSYRSTDFDVHRNWLAITHHLPLSEWYFNDVDGKTVHTLDYPPLFAFFEYFLSNNAITLKLLEQGWLDERCFQLLPDDDNEPSGNCVRFQRMTVILGDAVLFLGAYLASKALEWVRITRRQSQKDDDDTDASWITFLLIVTNPGLLMLDSVHFQYNGMLLGLLLCSISFLIRGTVPSKYSHWWELGAAATFGALLAMKHLYLTLAPFYLFYLLRHHCFIDERKKGVSVKKVGDGTEKENGLSALKFSIGRLIVLGVVTLMSFLGPFVPFLMCSDPIGQIQQILRRLFPFGRGLVHDYWAANMWALYLFASRVASFLLRRIPIPSDFLHSIETAGIIPFPEPSPPLVGSCLLCGLIPVMFYAWRVGGGSLLNPGLFLSSKISNFIEPSEFIIHAIVFSSFSSFMLGYHVHEKAIMTAIIPLTLLATSSCDKARFFIRTCYFGIFGLLPLLFRPDELVLKTVLAFTWMCGAVSGLEITALKRTKTHNLREKSLLSIVDFISFGILASLSLFMEVIHPVVFVPDGRLEFLPLMMTSVTCAVGLLFCWIQSTMYIFQ